MIFLQKNLFLIKHLKIIVLKNYLQIFLEYIYIYIYIIYKNSLTITKYTIANNSFVLFCFFIFSSLIRWCFFHHITLIINFRYSTIVNGKKKLKKERMRIWHIRKTYMILSYFLYNIYCIYIFYIAIKIIVIIAALG